MEIHHHELLKYQRTLSEALFQVETKVAELQQYKKDYEALSQVLTDLPSKTQCPVMVPFGSLGFMPGHIVHTNEITVLLGEDWYVERSASQARDIVQRRIQDLNTSLSTLLKEHKALETRQSHSTTSPYVQPTKELNEEGLPMLEICEPYSEPLSISASTSNSSFSSPPSSSLCYLDPRELSYSLSNEDQAYLSSIFDHLEDDDEEEEEERDPTRDKWMQVISEKKLSIEEKKEHKKKVTFSDPLISPDTEEADFVEVNDSRDIKTSIAATPQDRKPTSLRPVSERVIERDTSKEDQKWMQEEIERQVEHQQMLELYHQRRLTLLKQMEKEDNDELPRFNQPYFPSNPEEKIQLQDELHKLTLSPSQTQAMRTDISSYPDTEPPPPPPQPPAKPLSKFMQSRLSKRS